MPRRVTMTTATNTVTTTAVVVVAAATMPTSMKHIRELLYQSAFERVTEKFRDIFYSK